MNLDDKLREICDTNWGAERYHGGPEDDKAIAQIKQAFAEAGYLKFPQSIQEAKLMDAADVRMTGQEWYDRFIQELNSGLALPHPAMTKWVEDCARRAAGLTEDNNEPA